MYGPNKDLDWAERKMIERLRHMSEPVKARIVLEMIEFGRNLAEWGDRYRNEPVRTPMVVREREK